MITAVQGYNNVNNLSSNNCRKNTNPSFGIGPSVKVERPAKEVLKQLENNPKAMDFVNAFRKFCQETTEVLAKKTKGKAKVKITNIDYADPAEAAKYRKPKRIPTTTVEGVVTFKKSFFGKKIEKPLVLFPDKNLDASWIKSNIDFMEL